MARICLSSLVLLVASTGVSAGLLGGDSNVSTTGGAGGKAAKGLGGQGGSTGRVTGARGGKQRQSSTGGRAGYAGINQKGKTNNGLITGSTTGASVNAPIYQLSGGATGGDMWGGRGGYGPPPSLNLGTNGGSNYGSSSVGGSSNANGGRQRGYSGASGSTSNSAGSGGLGKGGDGGTSYTGGGQSAKGGDGKFDWSPSLEGIPMKRDLLRRLDEYEWLNGDLWERDNEDDFDLYVRGFSDYEEAEMLMALFE